ncbi:PH domain-containing protein [Deinococcus maricopensis]|uniref:Bacterial Pleckstrin homology domain-containing protein n=1 Tax=Deinococcus maricopensis (strain DSM 21211 / LMG 22137 / NRRL B-23946 / LB-34) TaxID=709986 RepID=E8UA46_DEIML|nr:PH domain-containing protein [Deinococcus maricopensis]ADV67935.1 hypothetical protein Deima_2297 [Deinococcus maricopensis DSM 21211]
MRYPPVPIPTRAAQWIAALLIGASLFATQRGFPSAWITVLALAAMCAAFLLPGARLDYRVEGRHLIVQTVFKRHTFPLRGARASVVKVDGALRTFGWSGLNGHLGRYAVTGLGPVEVYASTLRGSLLLLSLPGRPPLLLSPQDADRMALDLNGEPTPAPEDAARP